MAIAFETIVVGSLGFQAEKHFARKVERLTVVTHFLAKCKIDFNLGRFYKPMSEPALKYGRKMLTFLSYNC